MAASNQTSIRYEDVYGSILALTSWTEEQKTRLLDIITEWTTAFERTASTKLTDNLRYLLEILTDNVAMVPLVPVESIFTVIQSADIPSEAWLDCLFAAVQSTSDTNQENLISFDFTPVLIPTTVSNSSVLFNSLAGQELQNDVIDRSSLESFNITRQLLSFRPSLTTQHRPMNRLPSEEPLEEYRQILLDNLRELYQLKWDSSSIETLRQTFTNSQNNKLTSIKTALLVVETIVIHRISLRLHVERIVNKIRTTSSNKWMDELNKIVQEQGKNKSLQTLLHELGQENPSLNLVDLEQRYRTVMDHYETRTSKMTSFDIRNEQNYQNELYKIAVIIQAVYIYKQVRPRDIQILSLLLFIENQHEKHGRLAQIRTGEGKSIIISMLAVYLSLSPAKQYVDIITTSEILAKRDAEEFAPFYQMFNLTVGHNCTDPSQTPDYTVHIIYGTVNNFAGDLLRTEFYLDTKVRGNRPYAAVIVDEVDSMFIDQREHFTQLASLTPGYKSLNVVLKFIFIFFKKYDLTEDDEFVIRQENGFVKVKALDFIQEKLNDKKLIHFPQYRRSYIFSKLPKWIKSARRALYQLHEDVDYVISKNKQIVVVDYANTGVSHTNMHWSDGVHQFLQLKHNLRMTPERMCDSFYSNVTLFKKYQYLYGLSGTLGGKDAQEFIRKVYKIDVVIIPKYIDSIFEIYPDRFGHSRNEWLEKIRTECRDIAIRDHRAILIICQTIRDANDVQSNLRSQHSRIKLYLLSDEHTKPEEVHSGDVIVATNLAGRGTDLKVMTDVVDRGGLHVIVTFMPSNSRVQQQAFGRAGRQGQTGSARLIVYQESDRLMNEIQMVEAWKRLRDRYESESMAEAIEEVKRIEEKDRLLVRFLEIAHSRKDDLPFSDEIFQAAFSSLRESWGSFCDEDVSTANQRFPKFARVIQDKIEASITTMQQSLAQRSSPFDFRGGSDSDQARRNQIADAQCNALCQLISHPKYFIFSGVKMMCMKDVSGNEDRTLLLYQHALKIDDKDFIVHYNTVLCHIRNNQQSINQAIQSLNTALDLLRDEIERRKLLQIHDDPPIEGQQQTDNQSNMAELVYLHYVQSVFTTSRDQLYQYNEDKHEISCRCESWKEILTNIDQTNFREIKNEIQAEYEEWVSEGLIWLYVFQIEAKRCLWKTIFVFVMGIAQVVGGAFLFAAGHWKLGTSMCLQGAFDVYLSIATKITADFDIVDYFKQKVITYGLDLLCITPAVQGLVTPIASMEKLRLVGMGTKSIHELMTKGFNINTLTNIATTAMDIAGIDKKTIDFVKQVPGRYKDIQAVLSGDLNQIIDRGSSAVVDRFLTILDKDVFDGKSKAMFQIVQRYTPAIQHIYNGDGKALAAYAMDNISEILPQIPVTEMLGIGLPEALKGVIDKEQLNMKNVFNLAINQLNSMRGDWTEETFELVQKILNSPDRWAIFEKHKYELNSKINQILRPAIELERKFHSDYENLELNRQTMLNCNQIFQSLNVTFGTIQSQRNQIKRAIEREHLGGTFMQQAMMEVVDQLCQTPQNRQKSSKVTNALTDYLNENVIKPSVENACEHEMDRNDIELMDKFTIASRYIQEERKNFMKRN